jgi:HD-GYP domain-containing protein (c-di-GMP phosphodiesterase class II)/putative methionine-R-sulfoxide reductase with GAF domain
MKRLPDSDLNMFSSGILGILGVSLLLIPAQLRSIHSGELNWLFIFLGIASFAVALLLQTVTVLTVPLNRLRLTQCLSMILLFIFSKVHMQAGYILEGGILFFMGITSLLLILPFRKYFEHANLLNLTVVLISFSSGIFLAVSNGAYARFDLLSSKTPLAIGFFITAFLGSMTIAVPSLKYANWLSRLQAVPWLVWCIIFIPVGPNAILITPALLILLILLKDVIPWERLSLTANDILGHRVIMIAGTLELTLLIFLSALLIAIDGLNSVSNASITTIRDAAFLFFILISAVIFYEVFTIVMTINGLMRELTKTEAVSDEYDRDLDVNVKTWNKRLARYIKPFMLTREGVQIRLNALSDQIGVLTHQVVNEKKRNTQLILLMELSQQLENQLDQPVAAQLAVNTLERALNCHLACIYTHDPDQREFMLLAASGPNTNLVPSGYRQDISTGAIGRAVRQRKTQIINDIRLDADYLFFENENHLSAVIIPLIFNGHTNGVIVVNSENVNAFSSIDIGLVEAVAAELTRAWERSGYHQRLMNLIQAGSQLSSMVEPSSTAQEVAAIARDILQARFTLVHIQMGQERNFTQSASSGDAPRLLDSLQNAINSKPLIQTAFQAAQPFRVRDIRKYAATSHLVIDNAGLRSMLTIPIRWHRMNIGVIFAFGKQNEVFFTENDESLAELLSIQTAGAFESTWLQQELRTSLRITSLLYRLSNQIIQAENLEDAVLDIAQTAHKLAKSITTGIVLLDTDGKISADVEINSSGMRNGSSHPMELIKDAMESGQLIYFSHGKSVIRTCLPIQTPIRKYGAVWMDVPDEQGHNPATNPNDLQALVNQAAIALERSLLLVESRRQAIEIKAAYDTLEATYDQTLASLTSALDARDRETEGHSMRVSQLAVKLGETHGFSYDQLKVLERGSLLHDIGKIGISDNILHKPGPLNKDEWILMKHHPDIGAKIVEGIPFLEDTIPLIRHHQERWNGTGYPDGLAGEEIPLLARLFAVADAFDALTSNRPYRKKISIDEALQYIREQAGVLFDPDIAGVFEKMVTEDQSGLLLLNEP